MTLQCGRHPITPWVSLLCCHCQIYWFFLTIPFPDPHFDLLSTSPSLTLQTGLSKPGASSSTPAAQTASSVAQSRRVKEFSQLISFLAHCAPLFPTEMNALKLHQELFTLYAGHCETLDPILRRSLSQAIILLTNKGILSRQEVYPALFNTFRCADKELRRSIFLHIVSDVTKLQKTSNHKLMGQLQTLVFKYLKGMLHII